MQSGVTLYLTLWLLDRTCLVITWCLHSYLFNVLLWRILKNDELMRCDPLHDSLLLLYLLLVCNLTPEWLDWFMHLSFATSLRNSLPFLCHLHNLKDSLCLSTAWVFVSLPPISLYFKSLRVVSAISHLCQLEALLAAFAIKTVKIWPDLPIDLLPWNSIGLSNKCDEFLQVPLSINHMLCPQLTMVVNDWLSFAATHYLPLFFGEQSHAISALVKIVLFLL